MIDAVQAAGVVGRVGFTFRRTPGIAAAREQIQSGELGRPLYINAQYWTNYGSDPQAPMSWRYRGGTGSGALADLGSHLADTAEFLLGPVESVTGAALTTVIGEVRAEGLSFAQAVQHGAMVEPALGEPEMPPLLADLNALGVPLTAIVEHDLYPAPAGVPLPIATRTQQDYSRCGLRTTGR